VALSEADCARSVRLRQESLSEGKRRLSLQARVSIPVVFLPILALGGGPLRQIWEVRPAEKLIEPVGWTAAKDHPVLELAFSPNGSKLAATMDDHYDSRGFKTHLLILDIKNPLIGIRQFDLETCENFLAWADGNALLVCGRLVRRGSSDSRRRHNDGPFVSPAWDVGVDGKWAVAGTVQTKGWILLRQSFQRTINNKHVTLQQLRYR
jgi:hypothetical protein